MQVKQDSERKVKKAGAVIYGTNAQGERAFVAPYSEGRFGYREKYYALPKGSIDPGEPIKDAALREVKEETGIDIEALLGPVAFAQFLLDEPIAVPFESPGYPGVTVLRAGDAPVDHTYVSRGGIGRRTQLFGIEVAGIEHLQAHLKNPNLAEHKPTRTVAHSVFNNIADYDHYPQLDDFLEWLRTGTMPQRSWNAHIPWAAWPSSLYGVFTEEKSQFPAIEKRAMRRPIKNLKEWKEFCAPAKCSAEDYKLMEGYFASIKKTIGALGITQGDEADVKLDDKDTPLQFFQEGANLVTAFDFLIQCFTQIENNKDYGVAFGGKTAADHRLTEDAELRTGRMETVTRSQVAAIVPFVPAETLVRAALKDPQSFSQKDRRMTEAGQMLAEERFRKGVYPLVKMHPHFRQKGAFQCPDFWRETISNETNNAMPVPLRA